MTFGQSIQLDRGRVEIVTETAWMALVPEVAAPRLPFLAAYAIRVASLRDTEELMDTRDAQPAPHRQGAGRAVPAGARRRRMVLRRERRRPPLARLSGTLWTGQELSLTDAPHLTIVKSAVTWPDELFDVLKRADIRQVGYVPDAGHSRLIALCKADPDIHDVSLTTEEEGIALAAGAWLGGQRAVLLMQSSGVGNCVNMLSLMRACRFPMLMLVTMRGEWEEFNPWQVPMGAIVKPTLEAVRHPRHDGGNARPGRAAGADPRRRSRSAATAPRRCCCRRS